MRDRRGAEIAAAPMSKSQFTSLLKDVLSCVKVRMDSGWINVINDSGSMASEIQSVLDEQHKDASCISNDYDLNRKIADGIINRAVDLMRRSYGTGIFVVLNGPAAQNSTENTKAGFYIRDSNPGRSYSG